MDTFNILSTLLSVWIVTGVLDTCLSACPRNCHCDEDLQNIDCTDLNLEKFPEMLPESTVRLNISINAIQYLSNSQKLDQLKVLDISQNNMQDIDHTFFKNFPNLESLDLSVNNLKHIPLDISSTLQALYLKRNSIDSVSILGKHDASHSNIVQHLTNLKVLDMSGNNISKIRQCWLDQFPNLKYLYFAQNVITDFQLLVCENEDLKLQIIDFSQNNITKIEHGTFKKLKYLKYLSLANNNLMDIPLNMPTLDWLDLSSNHIKTLPENTTKDDVYPHEVVLLGGNPFHCDCNIQWLKEWFDTRKYLLKYIDVEVKKFVPVCERPVTLNGTSWNDVSFDDFLCDDTVEMDGEGDPKIEDSTSNLNLEAAHIGTNFVKLTWRNYGHTDLNFDEKVLLSVHRFGKKNSKIETVLRTSVGRYTVKGLEPSIGYIMCVGLLNKERKTPVEDCIEIVTLPTGSSAFLTTQLIWVIVLLALVIFLFYWLWLCYFKTEEHFGNNEKKIN